MDNFGTNEMTEDEALEQIKLNPILYSLPNKFHTKEFVLKCYDIVCVWLGTDDLNASGIKIDYDIVLSRCIFRSKAGYRTYMSKRSLTRIYSILSEQEIDKILMIVSLIK